DAFHDDVEGGGVEFEFACGAFAYVFERVDNLFAFALVDDDVVHAKQAQVVRNRGLREVEFFAESGDVAFARGKEHDDLQAGFVGEESKEVAEGAKGLLVRTRELGWHFLLRKTCRGACRGTRGSNDCGTI